MFFVRIFEPQHNAKNKKIMFKQKIVDVVLELNKWILGQLTLER